MRVPLLRLFGLGILAAATLLAAGCNSSALDSSDTTPQTATGVWTGTDAVTGLVVTAIITSGGEATFIRSDGLQFVGAVQVSGSTLAATVDGYPDFNQTFSDGSTYGIGTLSGTVTTASTISATLSFTTNDNTSITGTWSLTFDSLSTNASSVTTIAGTSTDSSSGATFTFSAAGAISITNSPDGCSLTGTISTADTTHDIYEVAYTYSGCTGIYEPLNGVQLTGLATLNSSLSPAQVVMTATGTLNGNYYGIISTLAAT